MNHSLRLQAASWSLAALVTLATLVGLDSLAHSGQGGTDQLAKAAATQPA